MLFQGKLGEYFELRHITNNNREHLTSAPAETLWLLWFTADHNQLSIDGLPYSFQKNEIVFLTQFHHTIFDKVQEAKLLRFNRPFYCVLDNDSEVGCKGILYYGNAQLPVIQIQGLDLEILEVAWRMSLLEFEMHDSLQQEMLQMMLKRILILCTRVYKNSLSGKVLSSQQHEIIREYTYLVDKHFREKHQVADYAELLFKSPKTISNLFKKLGEKSPLQLIQDRKMLEARRLLLYTEKDVSQVGYEIGFQDLQAFSRFFKKYEGKSPTRFRMQR